MTGDEHIDAARVDAEIDALAEGAFGFLGRLVGEASTVGEEAGAQAVVAAELERLGFAVDLLEVPESIAGDPLAGVPQRPYAGRPVVVGRLAGGDGPDAARERARRRRARRHARAVEQPAVRAHAARGLALRPWAAT